MYLQRKLPIGYVVGAYLIPGMPTKLIGTAYSTQDSNFQHYCWWNECCSTIVIKVHAPEIRTSSEV